MKVTMDTDQMQPSVWLDALVAEKVMGCRNVVVMDNPYAHNKIPRYSSDMKAAWEVVKEITGSCMVNYNPCITIHYFKTDFVHVFFKERNEITGDPLYRGIAETLPLAVCRCALKVVDKEGDDVTRI